MKTHSGSPNNVSIAQRTKRALCCCYCMAACVIAPLAALWPQGDPHPQRTTMFEAAQRGNVAAMNDILRGGLNVDCRDETGLTPLMAAARGGQLEAVRKLLAAGARIDAYAPVFGTPLMIATANRHHEVMRELIARGAD